MTKCNTGSCNLPNVDIFDPIQCVNRWNQCATQQQINVYLNAEIVKTQQCLQTFNDAQRQINNIVDGQLKGHEQRIKILEDEQKALSASQLKLQSNFDALQTSNNNYQLSVDKQLELYQTTINQLTATTNKLTTGQEALWSEVNALKGSIDPEKLNQAIAGYEAIMGETKALIAASEKETAIKLKTLENKFDELELNTNSEMLAFKLETQKTISDFVSQVNSDIEQQNSRLNAFITASDKNLADFKKSVNETIAVMQQDLEDLTIIVEDNKKIAHDELKETQLILNDKINNLDVSLSEKITVVATQSKDGDSRLEGIISSNDSRINNRMDALIVDTDKKLYTIDKDSRDRDDRIVHELNEKFDAKIKNLELTEIADVRRLDERIDSVYTELNSKINKDVSDLDVKLTTRITTLESDLVSQIMAGDATNADAIAALEAQTKVKLDEANKRIDNVESDINQVNSNLILRITVESEKRVAEDEKLQKQITDNKGATDESITTLNTRIDNSIVQAQEELNQAVSVLEVADDEINSRIDKVSESDQKQWTTINAILESNNQIRTDVSVLDGRVDRLEQSGGGAVPEAVMQQIENNTADIAMLQSDMADLTIPEPIKTMSVIPVLNQVLWQEGTTVNVNEYFTLSGTNTLTLNDIDGSYMHLLWQRQTPETGSINWTQSLGPYGFSKNDVFHIIDRNGKTPPMEVRVVLTSGTSGNQTYLFIMTTFQSVE